MRGAKKHQETGVVAVGWMDGGAIEGWVSGTALHISGMVLLAWKCTLRRQSNYRNTTCDTPSVPSLWLRVYGESDLKVVVSSHEEQERERFAHSNWDSSESPLFKVV